MYCIAPGHVNLAFSKHLKIGINFGHAHTPQFRVSASNVVAAVAGGIPHSLNEVILERLIRHLFASSLHIPGIGDA